MLVLVKLGKDINNVSCRRNMTKNTVESGVKQHSINQSFQLEWFYFKTIIYGSMDFVADCEGTVTDYILTLYHTIPCLNDLGKKAL